MFLYFLKEVCGVNNDASSGLKFSFKAVIPLNPILCTVALHASVLASLSSPLIFLKHCRLLGGIFFFWKGYQITHIYNFFLFTSGESFLSLPFIFTLFCGFSITFVGFLVLACWLLVPNKESCFCSSRLVFD